ncbi:hypothetical protein SAMN05421505_11821 [Sinosporangium album]|uniref:Uncharacterized protein n=1 Tax=Sinosporangium album TaxID=504805 RepID=A0A1G8DE83_9ACTN|nr:hypothetical protein [Sinosporangium album]SDH55951.1 hypothetical protein SAMN05421505_11821 [Sinosporangium album]
MRRYGDGEAGYRAAKAAARRGAAVRGSFRCSSTPVPAAAFAGWGREPYDVVAEGGGEVRLEQVETMPIT